VQVGEAEQAQPKPGSASASGGSWSCLRQGSILMTGSRRGDRPIIAPPAVQVKEALASGPRRPAATG
jgi:hypothetical protein